MLIILIVVTFLTIIALLVAQDSFLSRQFFTYNIISTKPYLRREFVLPFFQTWLPLDKEEI